MDYQFSESLQHFKSSAVREILKLTQGKSIISFAGGLPAEELFPVEAVRDAYVAALNRGNSSLQYGLTEGYLPLREALAERMRQKNITVTPDEMILTTGSQQSIDLLTRIYIDPGDVILVQQPTYLAALQVFQARGARVVAVKGDEFGMDLEDAAAKIKQHQPKLLYVTPTFSNPTGYVWNLERRQGILQLCRRHNVLILEDDPYGELQYSSDRLYPSIFSLDTHPHGSAVVYTSTFSKTVAPALRTGWAIGDPAIIRNMARAKQAADLHSSSMDQQALYELLCRFDLDAHIAGIRKDYEQRMLLMTDLLEGLNIPGLRWNRPEGGMFIWLELPEGYKAEELLVKAVEEGVAFVPGAPFYAGEPQVNTCRFNFTHSDSKEMKLGMERFARAMNSYVPSPV
ncbi:L,L-diaminopimelate aminotransferase [Chlamydia abortus]|uniref:aminotransferase-like domain-containing protein n=1 Tax=unclassified Paenibacillus TaxID=185978 RepID=UPI000A27BFF1|nr:PLP-dependent aminotransferase family protein [Paenibacillus sp. 32O-W]SHE13890.1 L,L-diaminopimelate aminotransferase [Chlamydia abortus]